MHLSPQILNPAELSPASSAALPTAQESLHLSSLVPLNAAQATPASVPELLSTVFHMCGNRWVADFLFSRDMTPLSALTAPVNLNHAITCTVTMTSVERYLGLPRCSRAPPKPFDIHIHGDYVFIPAFSVGPISVGFGIQNCAVKCQGDWGLQAGKKQSAVQNHFRYVRDDENGILVNIREDHEAGCYKVDYMEHETATKRRRCFLMIEREPIHEILRENPGGLDPQKLVSAIILVQTSEECRDCPFCGIPRGISCDCKLQHQTAKHPLDFNNMLLNMSSHLGSFEGVTAARFCTGGIEVFSGRLGSRITIDCTVDTDLVERLSRWAVTDQLKSFREDPVRCIMPAADEEMTDTGFAIGSSFVSDEATEVDVGGEIGEQEMYGVRVVDALVDEMTEPMKGIDFGDVTTDGVGGMATPGMFKELSAASTDGDDEVELANEIAREAQLAYQAENAVGEQSVPSGTSTTGVHNDVVESEEATRQQEKDRKAELRRQRNREAAQRSNAKRKEKNDTLKAALHESHARAAELRAKELDLREENIRLRKMVSQP